MPDLTPSLELLRKLGLATPPSSRTPTSKEQEEYERMVRESQKNDPTWKKTANIGLTGLVGAVKGAVGTDPEKEIIERVLAGKSSPTDKAEYFSNLGSQVFDVGGPLFAGLPLARHLGKVKSIIHHTESKFKDIFGNPSPYFDPRRNKPADLFGHSTHGVAVDPSHKGKDALMYGQGYANRDDASPGRAYAIKADDPDVFANTLDLVGPNFETDDLTQALAQFPVEQRSAILDEFRRNKDLPPAERQKKLAESITARGWHMSDELNDKLNHLFDAYIVNDIGHRTFALRKDAPLKSAFGAPLTDPEFPTRVSSHSPRSGRTELRPSSDIVKAPPTGETGVTLSGNRDPEPPKPYIEYDKTKTPNGFANTPEGWAMEEKFTNAKKQKASKYDEVVFGNKHPDLKGAVIKLPGGSSMTAEKFFELNYHLTPESFQQSLKDYPDIWHDYSIEYPQGATAAPYTSSGIMMNKKTGKITMGDYTFDISGVVELKDASGKTTSVILETLDDAKDVDGLLKKGWEVKANHKDFDTYVNATQHLHTGTKNPLEQLAPGSEYTNQQYINEAFMKGDEITLQNPKGGYVRTLFNGTPEEKKALEQLVLEGYTFPADAWEVPNAKMITLTKANHDLSDMMQAPKTSTPQESIFRFNDGNWYTESEAINAVKSGKLTKNEFENKFGHTKPFDSPTPSLNDPPWYDGPEPPPIDATSGPMASSALYKGNDEIDQLFENAAKGEVGPIKTDWSPVNKVSELSEKYPDLAAHYAMDSGTEIGSVGTHTSDVLKNYQSQLSPEAIAKAEQELGIPNLQETIADAIALHDIGKGTAVMQGNKSAQHEFTIPMMQNYLAAQGHDPKAINFVKQLFDHDYIGELAQGKGNITELAKKFQQKASDLGMSPETFMNVQMPLYYADAGSYPYVKNNFMVSSPEGKLSMKNPKNFDELLAAINTPAPVVPEPVSRKLFSSNIIKPGSVTPQQGGMQEIIQSAKSPNIYIPSKLEFVKDLGGSHGAKLLNIKDQPYVFKQQQGYRNLQEEYGSQIANMLNPNVPVSERTILPGYGERVLQKYVQGSKPINPDVRNLSPLQNFELADSSVHDWLIGNWDAHPGNFLQGADNRIIPIDKGQSFKHWQDEVFSPNYHPNQIFGESKPIYSQLPGHLSSGRYLAEEEAKRAVGEYGSQLQDYYKKFAAERYPDDLYMQDMFKNAQQNKLVNLPEDVAKYWEK